MQPRKYVAPAIHDICEPRIINHHGIQTLDIQRALAGRGHREDVRLIDGTFEKRADHPNRFAAVIKLRGNLFEPCADARRDLFHAGPRRQKHTHAALLFHDPRQKTVVEKVDRVRSHYFHHRSLLGIKGTAFYDTCCVQVACIERRVDRRREPDESAPNPLSKGQTQLQLGARLMDFIHHQRVLIANVTILEPTPGNARGHDDHIPRR